MTIEQLIKKLSAYPPDMEVKFGTYFPNPNGWGQDYLVHSIRYVRKEREDGQTWVALSDVTTRRRK